MKIIKSIDHPNISTPDEILLVYKDIGETSHDVINQVRKIKNTRKVGHSGVLDPFAEGLILVGVNKGTKEIWKYEDQTKEYEFNMVLGIQTLSGDHQDRVIKLDRSLSTISHNEIKDAVMSFQGNYLQTVPILSNVKIGGQKLREITRSAKEIIFLDNKTRFILDNSVLEIELPIREVTISNITLLDIQKINVEDILKNASDDFKTSYSELNQKDTIEHTSVNIRVEVSKGTYIRVLCEDIARKLNTIATLVSLKRTRIGEYH